MQQIYEHFYKQLILCLYDLSSEQTKTILELILAREDLKDFKLWLHTMPKAKEIITKLPELSLANTFLDKYNLYTIELNTMINGKPLILYLMEYNMVELYDLRENSKVIMRHITNKNLTEHFPNSSYNVLELIINMAHITWLIVLSTSKLNTIVMDGIACGSSAIFWLANTLRGQKILEENPQIISKITSESLNQKITTEGLYLDTSTLYGLSRTEVGRKLLLDNPELIEKISSIGLNRMVQSGEYLNTSPLYYLTLDTVGITILKKLVGLKFKTTTLNASLIRCRTSAIFNLSCKESGLKLLTKYFVQVTKTNLNQIVRQGVRKTSLLFELVSSKIGRQLLIKNPSVINKIGKEGLNKTIYVESYPNSALFMLLSTVEGRSILKYHQSIMEKITGRGLNIITKKGQSPITFLLRTKFGLDFLNKNSRVLNMCNQKCLNNISYESEYPNTSAVFFLASNHIGRQLLLSNNSLCEKISKTSLNAQIPTGKHKGISALFHLSGCKEGLEIIKNNPSLISKIHPPTLHQLVQGYNCSASNFIKEHGGELVENEYLKEILDRPNKKAKYK